MDPSYEADLKAQIVGIAAVERTNSPSIQSNIKMSLPSNRHLEISTDEDR